MALDLSIPAERATSVGRINIKRALARIANSLMALALFAMVALPLLETMGRRWTGWSVPGSAAWVQHLTLWLGLLGAIAATFKRRHLAVATLELIASRTAGTYVRFATGLVGVTILILLSKASLDLVQSQLLSPEKVGNWLPVWLAQTVMVLAFACMALGTAWRSGRGLLVRALLVVLPVVLVFLLQAVSYETRVTLVLPGVILLIGIAALGLPLYLVIGGLGLLLFYGGDVPIAAIPAETYRIATQPVLPSIPLFALAGTVLAAGAAPQRLIRLVGAWTSWLPGGPSTSTIIACAIFTAITGASGVTILAMGGMLLPVLIAAGRREGFATGLLTASGSVGLLFPPSLPVILYGVYGHVAIDQLFKAAALPGLLLIGMLAVFSVLRKKPTHDEREAFDWREAATAIWHSKGYLVIPVVVIGGLFSGVMTLVETAALTALMAIVLEGFVYRSLDLRVGLPKAMVESSVVVGALIALMGLALGLVSYLVDAQIPYLISDWVQQSIASKWVFLLVLNGLLLLAGAIMDIFSAILVLVPLIAPVGLAFGIDPVHLGIVFLANLELGYLTPPVGMNLFLASLRFRRPLVEIWRNTLPFMTIFVIWVLLVTYLPLIF